MFRCPAEALPAFALAVRLDIAETAGRRLCFVDNVLGAVGANQWKHVPMACGVDVFYPPFAVHGAPYEVEVNAAGDYRHPEPAPGVAYQGMGLAFLRLVF